MVDWLLVDGSSLIFRAFYGVPRSLRSPDGRLVNAVHGFLSRLARLVVERRPARLAIAADEEWRPTWRVELVPSYKAHRTAEPVPPELEPQLPVIDALLEAIGVDWVGWPEAEAEDVIATWVARVLEGSPKPRIEVVSGDRDLFSLVQDPWVRVLYLSRSGLVEVDEAEIIRRYGVPGRSYADLAVLRGDPSDGLPGLWGIGAREAAELLRRYGDLDGILASGRLSEEERDYLTRARRVVMLVSDLPVPLPGGRRERYPVDRHRLTCLSQEYGVEGPVRRLLGALSRMGRAGST
jgi:5'-3' exonuclease